MSRVRTIICLLVVLNSFTSVTAVDTQKLIYSAKDKVLPALVHIQPVIKNYVTGELEKQAVIGSGVIFHPDGYVVTNYHVAGKAERIFCTLYDKEIVTAEYIGGDPMTDLAVIKLDLSEYSGKIPVAEFGNSDSVQVGQYVLAMGSPLALSRSVSVGVISTKDRYFSSDVRLPSGERTGRYNLWIQTDAAINPGNSGGPLVELSGKVIGINSRATMFANNLGFAIPINVVKEVTAAVLKNGKVTRSWIGLHCQALQELEGYFGTNRNSGVLISSIDPGSPAEAAFLKAGDIILEVDGKQVSARFVEELPLFYSIIAAKKPGTEIVLSVLRGDQTYESRLTTRELGDLQGEVFECSGWGLTVKGITRQMQIEENLDDSIGVFIEGIKRNVVGDDGGLRRGDVIIGLDNKSISGLSNLIALYNILSKERSPKLFFKVKRSGANRFVVLNVSNPQEEGLDEE